MIRLPEGWTVHTAIDSVIYASPDRSIQVHYRMRVTPVRRVREIVDAALVAVPEWQTDTLHPRNRVVTQEGEHAFEIAADGRWLGEPARRYVGIVYGDDYANILDAITLGAGPVDARARLLLHGASLHLGLRRRRYFYTPPPGWHGHATGLVTHWFPPEFPRRPATIVAYPANPTHEEPHAVFDAVVAHQQAMGAELQALTDPKVLVARNGLEGAHWRLVLAPAAGPRVHRDLVVFVRGPFTYALQLDCAHRADDAALAAFVELARSVEPVPHGGTLGNSTATSHSTFAHFT